MIRTTPTFFRLGMVGFLLVFGTAPPQQVMWHPCLACTTTSQRCRPMALVTRTLSVPADLPRSSLRLLRLVLSRTVCKRVSHPSTYTHPVCNGQPLDSLIRWGLISTLHLGARLLSFVQMYHLCRSLFFFCTGKDHRGMRGLGPRHPPAKRYREVARLQGHRAPTLTSLPG